MYETLLRGGIRAPLRLRLIALTELNPTSDYTPPTDVEGNVSFQMDLVTVESQKQEQVESFARELTAYDMGNMLKRPVRVGSWTVTETSVPFTFNYFVNWLANPTVQAYLGPYRYLRGTFCLRYEVSGTPFQYGCYQVANFPQPIPSTIDFGNTTRVTLDTTRPYQLNNVPHANIDLSKVGSYEVRVPILSPTGWLPIKNFNVATQGAVIVSTHQFLVPPGTTAPPYRPWNLNVYAFMEDVEVSVPAQAEKTASFGSRALSSVARRAVDMAKSYYKLDTVESILKRLAPDAAQAMGFSKPSATDQVAVTNTRYNTDFSAVESARYFGYRSGIDPNGGVAISPDAAGFPDDKDDSILAFVSRPGLLQPFIWNPLSTSGTQVKKYSVTPTLSVSRVSTELMPTPLAYGSAPFLYWGGSLSYKFTVWASSFHKGTLRIVHCPNNEAPNSTNFNIFTQKIVEVAGTTSFDFVVPWMRTVPFLPLSPTTQRLAQNFQQFPTVFNQDQVGLDLSCMNGVLYIICEAPLVSSNANVPPVYITCEVMAGSDYRLARPSVLNLNGYKCLTSVFRTNQTLLVPPAPPLIPVSDDEEDNVLVVKAQSSSTAYHYTFGEKVESIRALAKVSSPILVWAFGRATDAISPDNLYTAEMVTKAYPSFHTDSLTVPPVQPYEGVIANNNWVSRGGQTFAGWFEAAFHAQRGGYRFAYVPLGRAVTETQIVMSGGLRTLGMANSVVSLNATATSITMGSILGTIGGDLTTPAAQDNAAYQEMEIPYSSPEFFRPSQGGGAYFAGPATPSTFVGPALSVQTTTWSATATTATAAFPPVQLWCGAADDYSLYGFAFIPIVENFWNV